MTPASALLAMIPPAFAILAERFNPISERSIRTSAARDLASFNAGDDQVRQSLITEVATIVEGAVEVSGLTPTCVACLTSGFGVLSEYPNPWLIVAYILVFLAVLLFVLHYLSGVSYQEMVTTDIPIPFLRGYSRKPVFVISCVIYFSNILLIVFIAGVFLFLEHDHLFYGAPIDAD